MWVFLFLTILVVCPPTVWGQEPEVDTGTTAWMLTSTALVSLMIPGLAMFYGGLVRTKNVLGTMMHCRPSPRGMAGAVLPYDFPNPPSHLAEDRSFSILRHPHHVISAIPSDVGLAVVYVKLRKKVFMAEADAVVG